MNGHHRLLFGALAALLLCLGSATAQVIVPPGSGTLDSAITSAVAGDTLVLQTGSYTGSAITITKNLTLRANTAGSTPVVDMNLGLDADVVLQGLTLNGTVRIGADTNQGFYENTFNDQIFENIAAPTTTSVVMVGNVSNNSIILTDYDDVVLAGNTLNAVTRITQVNRIVLAGNEMLAGVNCSVLGLATELNGPDIRLWANRIKPASIFNISAGNCFIVSVTGAGSASIRNNLFELQSTSGQPGSFRILNVGNTLPLVEIENNIFSGNGVVINGDALRTGSLSLIRSNIFFDSSLNNILLEFAGGAASRVENNLCFNTNQACPAGNGNLDADPLFVDTIDYLLDTGSPGIDAGPVDGVVLDIDGTTVDLGLYGGIFSIDQYDVQRQMGRVEPWVYPLFDATRGVDGLGGLQIRTLGVARLR